MKTPLRCPDCHTFLDEQVAGGLCPRCLVGEAAAPAEGPLEPPELRSQLAAVLPGYELLECLGIGGMGAVYKARQRRLDRMVAIKVLLTPPAEVEGWDERFEREARALARLSHKNIIGVHDFGHAEGLSYLILEYVEGANLRQLMAADRMSPAEALAIVPQVCDALQYAHDEGVVHRDIKPENILMDLTGHVKIADFGLAKIVDRPASLLTLTGSQQAMGTLRYMAPEQLERPREVDHRADIYSLGAVLYEMLTGEVPAGRFELPSQLREDLDPRLDEVVLRALERQPDRRYSSVSEIRVGLADLKEEDRVAAPVRAVPAKNDKIVWPKDEQEWKRAAIDWFTPRRDFSLISVLACALGIAGTAIDGSVSWSGRSFAMLGTTPVGGLVLAAFSLPLLAMLMSAMDTNHRRFQIARLITFFAVAGIYANFERDVEFTAQGDAFRVAHHSLAAFLAAATMARYGQSLWRRLATWERPPALHSSLRAASYALSGLGFLSLLAQEAFGTHFHNRSEARIGLTMIAAGFLLQIILRFSLRKLNYVRIEGLGSAASGFIAMAGAAYFMGNLNPDVGPVLALSCALPIIAIGLFELLAGGGPEQRKMRA